MGDEGIEEMVSDPHKRRFIDQVIDQGMKFVRENILLGTPHYEPERQIWEGRSSNCNCPSYLVFFMWSA